MEADGREGGKVVIVYNRRRPFCLQPKTPFSIDFIDPCQPQPEVSTPACSAPDIFFLLCKPYPVFSLSDRMIKVQAVSNNAHHLAPLLPPCLLFSQVQWCWFIAQNRSTTRVYCQIVLLPQPTIDTPAGPTPHL